VPLSLTNLFLSEYTGLVSLAYLDWISRLITINSGILLEIVFNNDIEICYKYVFERESLHRGGGGSSRSRKSSVMNKISEKARSVMYVKFVLKLKILSLKSWSVFKFESDRSLERVHSTRIVFQWFGSKAGKYLNHSVMQSHERTNTVIDETVDVISTTKL